MTRRYRRIEVKAFGRRFFLKAGGAVALAAVLPACDEPSTSDNGAGADVLQAGADAAGAEPQPCDEWVPDPFGEGADMEPFASAPPAGGWGEEIPPVSVEP